MQWRQGEMHIEHIIVCEGSDEIDYMHNEIRLSQFYHKYVTAMQHCSRRICLTVIECFERFFLQYYSRDSTGSLRKFLAFSFRTAT